MARLDLLRNVFLKTLYDHRLAFFWWGLGSGLMVFWMVTLFPEMASVDLSSFVESMPDSYRVMVGNNLNFGTLDGFLSLYLTGMWLPVMAVIIAITFSGKFIAGEEDEHSLDLLLSQPIPRWRVVVEKVLALVTFIGMLMVVNYLMTLLGLAMIDVDAAEVHLFEGMILNVLPMSLFFAGITLCLTGLRRGKGLATGVSGGLAGVTYLVNNLQETSNLPDWTLNLSPWYFYNGSTVLKDGIEWGGFFGLILFAVALIALGIWGFSQRDLGA